jgi:hypothetical protein
MDDFTGSTKLNPQEKNDAPAAKLLNKKSGPFRPPFKY